MGTMPPDWPATFGRGISALWLAISVSGPSGNSNVKFLINTDSTACARRECGHKNENRVRTLNSASANDLPRQVRGPSRNEMIWRWPWISLARRGSSASVSQRSGLNSFALGPQKTSDWFMQRIGTVTMVPLVTAILSTTSPDAVVMG